MPLRVDFHCRVIFTCVYKHANFNLVNKIEGRYKVLSFFFKVERGWNFTFTCDLSNIASILFANVNFTHVRDNGNPPLISFNKESLLERCDYSSTPPIARTYPIRMGFLYRVTFTYVHIRKQIVTLVERGSTFSCTRDIPYNASILYARNTFLCIVHGFLRLRNEFAWPEQCWTSCANGSNIVALRFGDHGTKEMLGVVGWKIWPVSNFAQQHATTSNNTQQGVQTDATSNIQQCCLRLHGA